MNRNENSMDFSGYQKHDRGLKGILEAVFHFMLGLFVIGCVYSFFLKPELGRIFVDLKPTAVEKLYSS